MKCGHLIVAPRNDLSGKLEPTTMLMTRVWNGVIYQHTAWDGTLGAALDLHITKLEDYKEEYKQAATPKDDWLVVTVDYHN